MRVQKIDNQQYSHQPAFKQLVLKPNWNRFASNELLEHVNSYSKEFESLGKDFDIIVSAHCGCPKRFYSNGVEIKVMKPVKGWTRSIKRFFSSGKFVIFSNCDNASMDWSKLQGETNSDSILKRLQTAIESLIPKAR